MADIINTRLTVLVANCCGNGRCFWRSAIEGRRIKPVSMYRPRTCGISGETQEDHFLLDRPKDHRLAFAVVSISARVWIYACLRISICKRDKQMRFWISCLEVCAQ